MGNNIGAVLKARRLTQAEVATALGVSRQAVQQWSSGRSAPNPKTMLALADYLQVPESQLKGDDNAPLALPDGSLVGNGGAYYAASKLDTEEGAWAKKGALFEKFIFSPAMNVLMESYGANPARLEHMTPSDDAMEPTLSRNSVCIIDRSQTDVVREGIYCFLTNSRVILRRAVIDLETHAVTLVPDNPRYPSIPRISRSARERIQCLGRAVYKLDGQPL